MVFTGGIFILAKKYKVAILVMIGLAVLTIFLFSGTVLFGPTGEGKRDAKGLAGDVETVAINLTEFKPADDPYLDFTRARNNNKPILLEFYARW